MRQTLHSVTVEYHRDFIKHVFHVSFIASTTDTTHFLYQSYHEDYPKSHWLCDIHSSDKWSKLILIPVQDIWAWVTKLNYFFFVKDGSFGEDRTRLALLSK